jgi:hypothetical protein
MAIACFLLFTAPPFPLALTAGSPSFFCASRSLPIGSQLFHTWPWDRSLDKQTSRDLPHKSRKLTPDRIRHDEHFAVEAGEKNSRYLLLMDERTDCEKDRS